VELSPDDRSYVFAVVRRILRCDDSAGDATQDALLLAHRFRDRFRGASALRTWLYRIAVTTALGHLRRQRRSREDLAPDDRALELADPRPSPEQVAATRQLASRARAALGAITANQRRVVLLRAEDHTEPEIAAALGISVANVKISAHRARRRLQRDLAA
jgi:RNA polymerase sigma-70 factor, ECF subfamily